MTPDQLGQLAQEIAERLRPAPEIMNTKEAAEYIRYSVSLLERMRKDGGGPKFTRPPGFRVVRYRKCDLDAWIAARLRDNNIGSQP